MYIYYYVSVSVKERPIYFLWMVVVDRGQHGNNVMLDMAHVGEGVNADNYQIQ